MWLVIAIKASSTFGPQRPANQSFGTGSSLHLMRVIVFFWPGRMLASSIALTASPISGDVMPAGATPNGRVVTAGGLAAALMASVFVTGAETGWATAGAADSASMQQSQPMLEKGTQLIS